MLVDWGLTIALAWLAVLAFQAEVAKPYRIPTPSMEPTLHCAKPVSGCLSRVSDRVIANRLAYVIHEPERGDIVVFDAPEGAAGACAGDGGTMIKRIVGLPGEKVSMRDGYVLVDGARLIEPYLVPRYRGHETGSWSRIAAGAYFVLGDNRPMSCDSRRWGVVRRGDIVGRAQVIYWPPNRVRAP